MSILLAALQDFISGEAIGQSPHHQIFVRTRDRTKACIKYKELNILVMLPGDTLNLEKILGAIDAYILNKGYGKRIFCIMFICSPRGSIYLYETIVNETIWKKNKRRNRICVINTDNGIVCFKPGHIMNKIISERLSYLLETVKAVPPEDWNKEMHRLFEVCTAAMKKQRI